MAKQLRCGSNKQGKNNTQLFLLVFYAFWFLPHRQSPKLSWIIGVHKVLNYISNFYSKNSTFHKPCSHRHSLGFYKASTLCLRKIRSWIIASRLQAVRLVLRHAKPPLTFSALLRRSLVSTRSAYAKSALGLLLHAFKLFA